MPVSGPPRLLIVAASMGAGHFTAARTLARSATARGAVVRVVDFLAQPPLRQGDAVRAFYRLMVTHAPWLYDRIMRLWARYPRAFEWITAAGDGGYVRGLLRECDQFRPDVVVSTYNLAGQALGRMRSSGRLRMPVVAYVTDAGAHPYWRARGADLHLAPLSVTAEQLRRHGAEMVEVVTPLAPTGAARIDRADARAVLGLPTDCRVVLVNGGSWGVGDVVGAARAARQGGALSVVLCGRSRRLFNAVSEMAGCLAVGWTDDVATWLAASDVVVDNAGGTTCWEALLAGRPVVLWRPLAGHGRFNARALSRAGLVTIASTPAELAAAAATGSEGLPRLALRRTVDAADTVLTLVDGQQNAPAKSARLA